MNTSQATAIMVILFALRCLVPLVLMFGLGYAMNWLVDRWEMEAARENEIELEQETAALPAAADPCWSIIKCSPEQRENCPGFQQQKIPCWLARTKAEGALPEKCVSCPLYKAIPSFA